MKMFLEKHTNLPQILNQKVFEFYTENGELERKLVVSYLQQ